MLHFITNLHSYLQVEVIESEWKRFMSSIEQAEDLDKIIDIQSKFIEIIHIRCMLTQNNRELYKTMIDIFDLISKFCQFQDHLYTSAIDEYHRRLTESDEMSEEPKFVSIQARRKLYELDQNYKHKFELFNEYLNKLEIDQKSLSFRLDFNEYYKNLKQNDQFGTGQVLRYDVDLLDIDSIDDEEDEEENEDEEDEDEEQIITQSFTHHHQMERGNKKFM